MTGYGPMVEMCFGPEISVDKINQVIYDIIFVVTLDHRIGIG